MIQFNLLPDVKIQYIKSQRTKRMVIVVAISIAIVSTVLLLLMVSYRAAQNHHLSTLNKNIKSIKSELEGNANLTKMLSVQNQLNKLPDLYKGRPAADRLPGYIEQTTPKNVGIGKLTVDFSTSSVEIAGTAASLSAINNYVDTLKNTAFTVDGNNSTSSAFTDVVLSKFGKTDRNTSYTITLKFDPQIFDESKTVNLQVKDLQVDGVDPNSSNTAPFNGSSTGDAKDEH